MTGACIQFASYDISLIQNPCQPIKNMPLASVCSGPGFQKLAIKRLQFYKWRVFCLACYQWHGRNVNRQTIHVSTYLANFDSVRDKISQKISFIWQPSRRIRPPGELRLSCVSNGSLGKRLIEKGEIWQVGRLLQKTPAQEQELGRCFLYQSSGRFTYMEIRKPRQGQSCSGSEEILLQTKGQGFYFPVHNAWSYFLHLWGTIVGLGLLKIYWLSEAVTFLLSEIVII